MRLQLPNGWGLPKASSRLPDHAGPTDLQAEDLLDEIHRQRDLARKARAEAEATRDRLSAQQTQPTARLDRLEEERMALLAKARAEADEELRDLRAELEEVRRRHAPASRWKQSSRCRRRWRTCRQRKEQPVERRSLPQQAAARPIKLGATG